MLVATSLISVGVQSCVGASDIHQSHAHTHTHTHSENKRAHTRNNNDAIGYVRQGLDLTNEIEVHTYVCTPLYASLGVFLKRK